MNEEFQTFPTLYKRDSKGKVRVWHMDVRLDGHRRAVSGLEDGKKVTSDWSASEAKNVGKANATDPYTQSIAEVTSIYTKQRESGYFESRPDIDTFDTFEPMLAEKYPDAVKKKKVQKWTKMFAQPKLDGLRCNVMASGIFSRNAKPFMTCDHIFNILKSKLSSTLVFDGELYNHNLRDDFNKIVSLVRKTKPTPEDIAECAEKVQYHVYDLFDSNSPNDIFEVRSAKLKAIVEELNNPAIVFVETVEIGESVARLDAYYGQWLEDGYEGQMVRNNTPYEQDRTWNLLKRKEFLTDEFPVVRVEAGKGNWSKAVKRFVLSKPDGVIFESGVRGSKEVLAKLLNDKCPDWATCRYFTPTPDGIPRFGVVVDWGYGSRDD